MLLFHVLHNDILLESFCSPLSSQSRIIHLLCNQPTMLSYWCRTKRCWCRTVPYHPPHRIRWVDIHHQLALFAQSQKRDSWVAAIEYGGWMWRRRESCDCHTVMNHKKRTPSMGNSSPPPSVERKQNHLFVLIIRMYASPLCFVHHLCQSAGFLLQFSVLEIGELLFLSVRFLAVGHITSNSSNCILRKTTL